MRKIFMSINCEIYWWNMGSKKLDHNGSVYEYMQSRSIKVSGILSPSKEMKGFRFKIPVSSCNITLDIFDTPERAAFEALKLFLSVMGDKSIITLGYRNSKINWR